MAASGFLFELTNVFFIPYVLLQQLGAAETVRTALGAVLVVVYTLARCVACTALAVQSLHDLGRFAPPRAACWLFAAVGLGCFYGLLLISWYWYAVSILPALHAALKQRLGDTYHHACCPAAVRRVAWRRLTREGRESTSEARLKFRALQELRGEIAADVSTEAAASPSTPQAAC